MSLRDLLKLVDDKLVDVFNRKAFDPDKARKRFLKHIETTRNQYVSATPVRGRKHFKAQNNVVAYAPPVPLEGRDTLYIPSERFGDFLTGLEQSVKAGELDKAFEAQEAGTKDGGGRSPGKPKAPRAGWSPARRAAHQARMAAKAK